ncbi:hypothetical protein [Reichenbachiella versicolor]|uniref:hypothetical protein n=1 Tax=Reichenbachiella versicolor TaxID=1821036 RepID=UPI000D6E4A67|nr:hypothetical protein [Reichenbachiella versicolor]
MDYELIIKPEAELDIADTMRWYDEKQEGLGLRFIGDLDQKIAKVQANPLHYQIRYKSMRMAFLDLFQDALHFIVEGKVVYVHAVLGIARDSQLWDKL